MLHRDEAVWSDVPRPAPELQLATVIAFVDFTRANGGTRIVPGSHRWPDRNLSPAEQFAQPPPTAGQIAYAEMPAGSAVVYTGGTIHAGGSNVTGVPRRGAHLSYCLGWLRTRTTTWRCRQRSQKSSQGKPKNCSATPCTTASLEVVATSAWCTCKTPLTFSAGTSFSTSVG